MQQLLIKHKDKVYDNNSFNFIVSKKDVPDMPTSTIMSDEIPYSSKKVIYRREDGTRIIPVSIYFKHEYLNELNKNINDLNNLLKDEIVLKFNDNPYSYICNLIDFSQENIIDMHKIYTLTFETTDAYRYSWQKSNEELSWEWAYENIGINRREPTIYNITSNTTIKCDNFGNYPAKPIVKIQGTCNNITIGGMTYNASITDNLTIDTEKEICYRDNNGNIENKRQNLSGEFLIIIPGENEISITGSNMNLTLELIYRHTYR